MKTGDDPNNPGETMRVPFEESELASQRMGGDRYVSTASARRPGGLGRSYFTDVKYAKPDADVPVMTEAEAREANRKEAEAIFARQNPSAGNP